MRVAIANLAFALFAAYASAAAQQRPAPRAAAQIHVGPNHRASADDTIPRNEGWIAASLKTPGLLVAASHKAPGCGAMLSRDGGQLWEELRLPQLDDCFDPMTASSADGVLYVLSTARSVPPPRQGAAGVGAQRADAPVRMYSSVDGGKTWRGPAEMRTPVRPDHPRFVVDQSTGPRRGRVYVAWNEVSDTWLKRRYNIFLHFSDDSGRTFSEPTLLGAAEGGKLVTTEPVVLSDGTLLVTYYQYFQPLSSPKNERQPFYILRSTDGGATFGQPEKVLEIGMSGWRHLRRDFSRAFTLPIVAADVSPRSRFRDRVYVVWDDVSAGDADIWLTWSSDGGRTWAAKRRVNDNPAAPKGGPPDFRMTPVVSITPDGVVGVAWYDRRDDPAHRCWKQYFTASLDGGDTFLPNVAVSSKQSCPEKDAAPRLVVRHQAADTALPSIDQVDKLAADGKFADAERLSIAHAEREAAGTGATPELRLTFNRDRNVWPGHYTGLTNDTTGAFYALWADRRSGRQQMYAARIDVVPGEEREPAGLREQVVTDLVQVVAGPVRFDEAKRTSEVTVMLRNASSRPLYAPLRLRVRRITTPGAAGDVEFVQADAGGRRAGATWDFSNLLGTRRRLDPKGVTEARTLEIRTGSASGYDVAFEFEVLARVGGAVSAAGAASGKQP